MREAAQPRAILLACVLLIGIAPALGQPDTPEADANADAQAAPDLAQARIVVDGAVDDAAIAARLRRIFEATPWYREIDIRADAGVVFIRGEAEREEHRSWGTRLARQTEGVVAVVNTMRVRPRSMWDLSGTWTEVGVLARAAIHQSPLALLALVLLLISWVVAGASSRIFRTAMRRRWKNALLRTMVANAIGVLIFILGLYFVLRISGLTRLAVTVLGGTGLFGLVVGFAFRDIAENFLASLLMSIQRPFLTGDMVEVAGTVGYVQQVNSRSTVLMTFDGNHVQIPNATVYKERIVNYWANPQMRSSFVVGIGYDTVISQAQEVGMRVMREHAAVLDAPEPAVLVDKLGTSTVNLRFWFWINVRTHSEAKVRSALQRLCKRAYQEAGISMPDEAREIVFPDGVPVRLTHDGSVARAGKEHTGAPVTDRAAPENAAASADAEGGDCSDSGVIEEQARAARMPEGGRNLLEMEND